MTSPALQDIIALFGCPAAGNPAQYLFEHGIERVIEEGALDWRFVSVDVSVERVGEALTGAAAMGFRGCLLDGALRTAALPFVSASPAAAFAGAASLVDRGSDGWVAHMTDGRGVVEAVRSHLEPSGRRVLVAGAGPRGRAVALEFVMTGAAGVTVCDPDTGRADALVESLRALESEAVIERGTWPAVVVPDDVRIVVSTLSGPDVEMSLERLRPDLVVAEAILSPEPARAGREALAAGACLVDGLEIHATRAAIDFQQITGLVCDADLLRDALDEFLAGP